MMLSSVSGGSGLSGLYLNGAKVPIVVTNQRSNRVQLQPPFNFSSSSALDAHHQQQKALQSYRLQLGGGITAASPILLRNPKNQLNDTDKKETFQQVDELQTHYNDDSFSFSERNARTPSTTKHATHCQTRNATEITVFPPAHHSSSLVTIGAPDQQDDRDEQESSADVHSLSGDEEPCPGGQTEDIGHPASGMSSCSRSSKENFSPKPPESKKKKVKQKPRKLKKSLSRRNIVIKKSAIMRQNVTNRTKNQSPGAPSTAPESSSTHKLFRLSCAPVMMYTHISKPKTAQSVPEFPPGSLKQRHDISRAIYSRQTAPSCGVTSRSRTLPTVESSVNSHPPRQSTSGNFSSTPSGNANDLEMRLSGNSKPVVRVSDAHPNGMKSSANQYWGRLVKIYLSEKQSGSLKDKDGGTEYPCAPPATPTPDQLQRYRYIPSMNDVKAQRAVKNKLLALEKAEQKRQDKQKGKKIKADQQALKDNEKVLKQRQRQEIYALNAVMTDLEYNRFVAFCLSNNIQLN